jgi:yeast amino acid transporter
MMVFAFPILYLGYKFIRRTPFIKAADADLVKNLDEIEEYERNYVPKKSK